MTKTLHDTFHEQADARDFPVPDLDAIVRQGGRRIRRRRTAGIAAAAAGVLAVAGTSLALPRGGAPKPPPLAAPATQPLTYAVGSTLHVGAESHALDQRPLLMVQTANGVVYGDSDLHVFAFDGARSREVGTVAKLFDAHPRLVTDEPGTSVAWLERLGTEITLAVLDVRTDQVARSPLQTHGKRSPSVRAVDDGTVYLYDGRGIVSRDVATGATAVLRTSVDSAEALQDVAGSTFLYQDGGDGGMVTGTSMSQQTSSVPNVFSGDLSPDGRYWLTQDGDEFSVYDATTGKRTDPPHPGYAFAAPYQWLDDDSVAALALKGDDSAHIALLTCTVSTDTCDVTNPDIGGYRAVMLPFGEPLDD